MGRPLQFDAEAAVEAAMRLFWRDGYAGTTPQALTTELGIGRGSLYHSFESKHNLFVLSLARYTSWRAEFLSANFIGKASVRAQVRQAVEVLTGLGDHDRGCLLVNASAELGGTDPVVAVAAEGLFTLMEDVFRDAIRRGQVQGEFDPTRDASAGASGLLATVIGASVLLKAKTDERRVARTITARLEAL